MKKLKLTIIAGLFTYSAAFSQFVSTSEVKIQGGPYIGNSTSDISTHVSEVYKVTIFADDPSTTIDDMLTDSLNAILTIRYKIGTPITNRWIVFEAGGEGKGYAQTFGQTMPGDYIAGGAGYGDDLIRWYNDSGFVTLDVTYECSNSTGCNSDPNLAGWCPPYATEATGWMRNTGQGGYTPASSRTRAILEWALANNGGNCMGAHCHSSGSGRILTTLTRYGGEKFFNTVVFDGGPVFAYIPWYCETDSGPLGPRPANYALDGGSYRFNYDDASGINNNIGGTYTYCSTSQYAPDSLQWIENSNFLQATDRDFPDVNMVVVLGGLDGSPAAPHCRLWFNGYTYGSYTIPALNPKTLTIIQGYCSSYTTGNYSANGITPCTTWDISLFPTANSITYDPSIVSTNHSTTQLQPGALACFNAMLSKIGTNGSSTEICPHVVTGISDATHNPEYFRLYPNPATSTINIESYVKTPFELTMLNVFGQIILQQQSTDNKTTIDISKFNNGIYFFQVNSQGKTFTYKIIIEN